MITTHKLSNLVLKPSEFLSDHKDLFFRTDSNVQYDNTKDALFFSGTVDFLTYFNCCSVGKWEQYTNVKHIKLHLVLSGDICFIQFNAAKTKHDKPVATEEGKRLVFDDSKRVKTSNGREAYSFDLDLPQTEESVVGFTITTHGEACLFEAYYYAEVDEKQIRPVKLALSTTTFKKEEYIVPNIELVKREIINCDDPIADNFHMFVIDNGQTLDWQNLSDLAVTVVPNKNVGGSGGFARGMMEALSSDEGFTHVLLMDDDVRISTESLKRTYNLLSLTKDEYKDAFINGAMLAIEKPNMQFEDVSYVVNSGAYRKVKENLFINNVEDISENESINVEVPHSYGAWWYSCIPVSRIKEQGLPLPLFVRCDDVEYGMRTNPTYMTMNGICVWHEAFEGRFRASVDCYQYVRNFLIMIAADDCASEKLFLSRMERNIRLHLRTMEYDTADLFLDGFEDYLKGPEYLAQVSGEDLMKKNGAKNEKLVPVEDLPLNIEDLHIKPKVLTWSKEEIKRRENKDLIEKRDTSLPKRLFGSVKHNGMRLWRTLPYDRHYLPESLLKDKPKPVFYSGLATCGAYTMGSKTLVALDKEAKNGAVRHYDKSRWDSIHQRLRELKKIHKERGREIRKSYKDALPYLTSWEFWNEYLGTDLKMKE